MRLLLVRHGETAQPRGRYWGHTDAPLSDRGVRQAESLAARLASEALDCVLASDLARAAGTAAAIAEPRGLPVQLRTELREINFGLCEGLSNEQLVAAFPEAVRCWDEDGVTSFPDGESAAALIERTSRFLRTLLADHSLGLVLIVGHGGPLSIMICLLLGLDPRRWWQLRVDIASLSVVETYPEGSILTLFNDTCHLAEPSSSHNA